MPVRIRSLSLRSVRSIPLFLFYRESKKRSPLPRPVRSNPSQRSARRGRRRSTTRREGSPRATRRDFSSFPSITPLSSPTPKSAGNIGSQVAISSKWPNSSARRPSSPPNPENSARASTSARRRKYTRTSTYSRPPSSKSNKLRSTAKPSPSSPITSKKWRSRASTCRSSTSVPPKMWS